jgi:hypothetical protein
VRQIFEYFEVEKEIAKLDESDRLHPVIGKFADMELVGGASLHSKSFADIVKY